MSGEFYKGLIHFGAGVLAGTMDLYQGLRLTEETDPRQRRRLQLNAVVYTAALCFEAYQTYHHWSRNQT